MPLSKTTVPGVKRLDGIITLIYIYSAIPRKNLQARGAVHYQHQHPLDNQVSTGTSTINAYITIKMTTTTTTTTKPGKKKRKKKKKHNYCKCVHQY